MDKSRLLSAIADRSASDYGFMIAFIEGDFGSHSHLGFGFLANIDDTFVYLNAVALHRSKPFLFRLTIEPCKIGSEAYKGIVSNFLGSTATDIGLKPEQLVCLLDKALSPFGDQGWRFVGVYNKDKTDTDDSLAVWRSLWGRIVESVGRISDYVPGQDPEGEEGLIDALTKKLLYEANSGQIVLNK